MQFPPKLTTTTPPLHPILVSEVWTLFQGRCVICGGPGISDAYYCKECTVQEKDRDGCPKIVNLGSSKTDLFYEMKKYGFKKRWNRQWQCILWHFTFCKWFYNPFFSRSERSSIMVTWALADLQPRHCQDGRTTGPSTISWSPFCSFNCRSFALRQQRLSARNSRWDHL